MSNEKSKSTFFSEIFAKTALIALFSISSPEGAFALDSSSSSSTIENEYQFRAPTINQPQIQLTDDMQNILKVCMRVCSFCFSCVFLCDF